MGVMYYLESVKNWTLDKLSIIKNDDKVNPQHFPNLGEDIRKVVHTPEFEHVMNSASPFLLACLGAWPGYWMYRGFDYHSHRAYVPLPMYIRQVIRNNNNPPPPHNHYPPLFFSPAIFHLSFFQTFYQAKLLQIIIITAGIVHIFKEQNTSPMFPTNK